jgi:hypothetical protein
MLIQLANNKMKRYRNIESFVKQAKQTRSDRVSVRSHTSFPTIQASALSLWENTAFHPISPAIFCLSRAPLSCVADPRYVHVKSTTEASGTSSESVNKEICA